MGEVEIEIMTHRGFAEWTRSKRAGAGFTQVFGRHQFIYKRNGNEISMVEISLLPRASSGEKEGAWIWEIYCVKGNLFQDTKRFTYKQEAENYIMRLLYPEDQL